MRFGVRATTVDDVNKVSTGLITTRRVIFSPSVEIKDELKETSINITCYDRDGKIVKRVTSTDPGEVEDPEEQNTEGGNTSGSGSNTSGSGNTSGGGSSSGGGNSGSDDEGDMN